MVIDHARRAIEDRKTFLLQALGELRVLVIGEEFLQEEFLPAECRTLQGDAATAEQVYRSGRVVLPGVDLAEAPIEGLAIQPFHRAGIVEKPDCTFPRPLVEGHRDRCGGLAGERCAGDFPAVQLDGDKAFAQRIAGAQEDLRAVGLGNDEGQPLAPLDLDLRRFLLSGENEKLRIFELRECRLVVEHHVDIRTDRQRNETAHEADFRHDGGGVGVGLVRGDELRQPRLIDGGVVVEQHQNFAVRMLHAEIVAAGKAAIAGAFDKVDRQRA